MSDFRKTAAAFILREAKALGIRVGTNGDELVMIGPLRLPHDVRRSFEAALYEYKSEVIANIMAQEHSS